jgi:DNA polymerase-4
MATSPQKWIMHLDMDAFFASVEQHDHPEYQGRPVVVGALPGRRGVVSTCSYEARKYGIRSAMPISEAHRRCPDAVYLRPDMNRYVAVSRQVMGLLGDISPVVEPVSIDEAYVDISGLERLMGSPEEIGRFTKQKIREETGLTCSVGIGLNRLIAKLASEHRKPDGLVVVRPEEVQAFLDPMPVSNLRGVGAKTRQGLERLGIHTVAQLRACSQELLQTHFGKKGGSYLYHQARGIASDRVGNPAGRQSISKETTFNRDTTDQQRLRESLRELAAEVGQIARRKGLRGQVVTLKIRLQDFETHVRQLKIAEATNADGRIFSTAWELYQSSGFAGRAVRLIGVGISEWGEGARQEDLFDSGENRKREEDLYATLDRVNEKFGDGVLLRGMKK